MAQRGASRKHNLGASSSSSRVAHREDNVDNRSSNPSRGRQPKLSQPATAAAAARGKRSSASTSQNRTKLNQTPGRSSSSAMSNRRGSRKEEGVASNVHGGNGQAASCVRGGARQGATRGGAPARATSKQAPGLADGRSRSRGQADGAEGSSSGNSLASSSGSGRGGVTGMVSAVTRKRLMAKQGEDGYGRPASSTSKERVGRNAVGQRGTQKYPAADFVSHPQPGKTVGRKRGRAEQTPSTHHWEMSSPHVLEPPSKRSRLSGAEPSKIDKRLLGKKSFLRRAQEDMLAAEASAAAHANARGGGGGETTNSKTNAAQIKTRGIKQRRGLQWAHSPSISESVESLKPGNKSLAQKKSGTIQLSVPSGKPRGKPHQQAPSRKTAGMKRETRHDIGSTLAGSNYDRPKRSASRRKTCKCCGGEEHSDVSFSDSDVESTPKPKPPKPKKASKDDDQEWGSPIRSNSSRSKVKRSAEVGTARRSVAASSARRSVAAAGDASQTRRVKRRISITTEADYSQQSLILDCECPVPAKLYTSDFEREISLSKMVHRLGKLTKSGEITYNKEADLPGEIAYMEDDFYVIVADSDIENDSANDASALYMSVDDIDEKSAVDTTKDEADVKPDGKSVADTKEEGMDWSQTNNENSEADSQKKEKDETDSSKINFNANEVDSSDKKPKEETDASKMNSNVNEVNCSDKEENEKAQAAVTHSQNEGPDMTIRDNSNSSQQKEETLQDGGFAAAENLSDSVTSAPEQNLLQEQNVSEEMEAGEERSAENLEQSVTAEQRAAEYGSSAPGTQPSVVRESTPEENASTPCSNRLEENNRNVSPHASNQSVELARNSEDLAVSCATIPIVSEGNGLVLEADRQENGVVTIAKGWEEPMQDDAAHFSASSVVEGASSVEKHSQLVVPDKESSEIGSHQGNVNLSNIPDTSCTTVADAVAEVDASQISASTVENFPQLLEQVEAEAMTSPVEKTSLFNDHRGEIPTAENLAEGEPKLEETAHMLTPSGQDAEAEIRRECIQPSAYQGEQIDAASLVDNPIHAETVSSSVETASSSNSSKRLVDLAVAEDAARESNITSAVECGSAFGEDNQACDATRESADIGDRQNPHLWSAAEQANVGETVLQQRENTHGLGVASEEGNPQNQTGAISHSAKHSQEAAEETMIVETQRESNSSFGDASGLVENLPDPSGGSGAISHSAEQCDQSLSFQTAYSDQSSYQTLYGDQSTLQSSYSEQSFQTADSSVATPEEARRGGYSCRNTPVQEGSAATQQQPFAPKTNLPESGDVCDAATGVVGMGGKTASDENENPHHAV